MLSIFKMYRSSPTKIQRVTVFFRAMGGSYWLSGLTGLLTYITYALLNDAWGNYALAAIAVYLYLSIPAYSRLSNRLESRTGDSTGLTTIGRVARYTLQFTVNCALLYVFLAGGILDRAGLGGIGGFFGAAAWVTAVSQGGQYAANWLATIGVGSSDRNVIISISVSVVVNALAVSGVVWIQSIYVGASLFFAGVILLSGVLFDIKTLRIPTRRRGSRSVSTL